jgi:hypothetical protein
MPPAKIVPMRTMRFRRITTWFHSTLNVSQNPQGEDLVPNLVVTKHVDYESSSKIRIAMHCQTGYRLFSWTEKRTSKLNFQAMAAG